MQQLGAPVVVQCAAVVFQFVPPLPKDKVNIYQTKLAAPCSCSHGMDAAKAAAVVIFAAVVAISWSLLWSYIYTCDVLHDVVT